MKMAAPLLASLALARILHAWPSSDRGFVSLDYIPAFAVCTVERVVKLDQVAAAEKRFPWPDRRFEISRPGSPRLLPRGCPVV
jgi:hypothetical protein